MANLSVVEGADKGRLFRLRHFPVTIGRMPDNTIVLNDTTASAYHCKLTKAGDVITVEDLSSTNGTIVNGKEVDFQDMKDGDEILVGKNTLIKFQR